MNGRCAVALVATVALLLASCGDAATPTTGNTQSVTTPTVPVTTPTVPVTTSTMDSASGVTPELSVSDLVGVWWVTPGGLVAFAPDGRFWSDTSGKLAHAPDIMGTFEVADDLIRFTQTADSVDCPTGTTSAWRTTMYEDGQVTAEWTEHTCYPATAGVPLVLTRVSPDSRFESTLPSQPPESSIDAHVSNFRGAWLIMGTSMVIEFDGAGSYIWDDKGELPWRPAETGKYEVDFENQVVELTVVESTVCSPGDVLRMSDTTVVWMAGIWAAATDDCDRLAGDIALALLSN